MGIWARSWAEARGINDTGWLTRDDGDSPAGTVTSSGVSVNARVALSLTTIWRCIDLLASAVSQAPKDITIRIGSASFEEYTEPQWLAMPNPANPNYTANDYFYEVAASLLMEGNYFVRVVPNVDEPIGLLVVPPSRVKVRPGPLYDILGPSGAVVDTLTPYEMLHGIWMPDGTGRGVSPLESLRRAIGSAVAAEDHASRFFGQGAALSFGVEVPYAMDATKLQALRDSLRAKYAGTRNSHAIGVLADGGKFVAGLAPSPEQAQMLQTRKFSVEDLCRPYGIPPAMAGSTEPGAASFAATETYDRWYKSGAVLPLANRIEAGHRRLARVPDTISDPRARAQFKFNLDAVARVDLLTRSTAYKERVLSGTMTPNQVRALEDEPPLPGGDLLYMQQQMVPLADLGKTKATEPLDTQPAPAGSQHRSVEEAEERRHVEIMAMAAREPQISIPVTITNPAPIHVDGPQVTVQPSAPAQVHVDGAQVHVAPAAVTVEPPTVNVQVPEPRATSKTIERDAQGQIVRIVEA